MAKKIYKVSRGQGKKPLYVSEADAFQYASIGKKIVLVKTLPKGYKL
jgi:hypothetical protein